MSSRYNRDTILYHRQNRRLICFETCRPAKMLPAARPLRVAWKPVVLDSLKLTTPLARKASQPFAVATPAGSLRHRSQSNPLLAVWDDGFTHSCELVRVGKKEIRIRHNAELSNAVRGNVFGDGREYRGNEDWQKRLSMENLRRNPVQVGGLYRL